jgi:diacylglycerol kinase family enzyme
MVSNSSPWTYLGSRPVRTNPGTSFDTGLGLFAVRTTRVLPSLRITRQLLFVSGGPKSSRIVRVDDVPGVRIRSNRPIGLQMDGDYLGTRRVVDFTAQPAAVQVVAPKLR